MGTYVTDERKRIRIRLKGLVQGVGFRPFVYRLAQQWNVKGWVNNSTDGVIIEAEATETVLASFIKHIRSAPPAHCLINHIQCTHLEPQGETAFVIKESQTQAAKTTLVLPDIATCPECLKEVFDPSDRRYLYPFANCIHCGPRYSIIEAIPYDRANTSMNTFTMCPACQNEYDDPNNRRFHAQPNACPTCGPQLELWDRHGKMLSDKHSALLQAVEAIKAGNILAIKGIGGFHLVVDAAQEQSVLQLKQRKHREEKPLALMMPSLAMIEQYCHVAEQERTLLTSSAAPIVLLHRKSGQSTSLSNEIAESVAPGNPNLGVMLPYSPLHHLLMQALQRPIVATSGNISDEPICTDETEALTRLADIADLFLAHNRPIVRSIDDSVARVIKDRPMMLRRARGYAPLPVTIQTSGPSVLAVGGHLKNTMAISVQDNVFISQHIGDLSTRQALDAYCRTTESLKQLYEPEIKHVVCDMHPDYDSTKLAQREAKQEKQSLTMVQHHHAHIAACMAEHHVEEPVLGMAFDGTGWGPDHTVWGGEFLLATLLGYQRVGYFKPFPLLGSERAIQEPRRAALAILFTLSDEIDSFHDLPTLKAFTAKKLNLLLQMARNRTNAPLTSSVGRLFDAVASLLGLCQSASFEGQAAMALEYILPDQPIDDAYAYTIHEQKETWILDWSQMIEEVIANIREGVPAGVISVRFHNTIVEMSVDMAQHVQQPHVILSGGCFQNEYLSERLIDRLGQAGFKVDWHQSVPPNDGGLSLGQASIGIARLNQSYTTIRKLVNTK